MSIKKTDLEYVRAWMDAEIDPNSNERTRSQAFDVMMRTVLPEYDPKRISRSLAKTGEAP